MYSNLFLWVKEYDFKRKQFRVQQCLISYLWSKWFSLLSQVLIPIKDNRPTSNSTLAKSCVLRRHMKLSIFKIQNPKCIYCILWGIHTSFTLLIRQYLMTDVILEWLKQIRICSHYLLFHYLGKYICTNIEHSFYFASLLFLIFCRKNFC